MKRHPKKLQTKAAQCTVQPVPWDDNTFQVTSPSGSTYTVVVAGTSTICTCPWREYHANKLCAHALAALAYQQDQADTNRKVTVSLWTDYDRAKRQKKAMLTTPDSLYITLNRRQNGHQSNV